MLMIIKLESWEYEYASTIGIRRYTNNWGKPDAPHYDPNKMEDNRTALVAAAIGELAVAKAINQYWSASIWKSSDHKKYKDLPDVGTNIEVRRVRTQDGPAVREKDIKKEGLIIFGVVPIPKEFTEVEILGWIPAQEGWDKGTQMKYGRMIHKDLLYPVEQFDGTQR
jgi:hypothetical protein